MSEQQVLDRIFALVRLLRRSGMEADAAQLETIVRERFIWDQMALRVADQIRGYERPGVPADIKELCAEVLSVFGESLSNAYEVSVYEPVRELAARLEKEGFLEWRERLEEAMARGATGTEIYMALRWELGKLLEEQPGVHVEFEARRLYRLLDVALRMATESRE